MTYIVWGLTAIGLTASFIANKKKTIKALKLAGKRLWKITPLFFYVMALTSIAMNLLPPEWIRQMLGEESGIRGLMLALGLGSVTMMPGMVAFPLSAMLKSQGVPYMVLAAFTMALMNIGVVTFPLERSYLGTKVAMIRNAIGLAVTLIVTLMVALAFGEVIL